MSEPGKHLEQNQGQALIQEREVGRFEINRIWSHEGFERSRFSDIVQIHIPETKIV